MAKRPTLADITTGHGTTTKLNANFDAIEVAFDNTLSRDGSSPNAMEAALDMNSNQILNLPDATTDKEPLTYGQYIAGGASAVVNGFRKETQTATSGQTVFTVTSVEWVPGIDNLIVFVNGELQGPGLYTVNSSTQITFTSGLSAADRVDFVVMQIATTQINTTIDAGLVSYNPLNTTNVTNVETKLRESVSVKDFGAIGDGVTDDTAALKAAFDYAIPLAKTVLFPSGTYKITGPIQPYQSRTSGSIHIFSDGLVQIVVDASSTAFTDVLYLETTNFNSCSITGGIFEINGNNKAGRGITFRHNDGSGGDVNITAEVKIKNIKENDASATRENQALSVYGDYGKINIENVYIEGVQRTNAAGATKGLAVSQFSGNCSIENVFVKDVLLPSVTDADADGIAIFGKSGVSTYNKRDGVAYVSNCVFEDCQGRALKSQSSEITVMRPRVKRRVYVGMVNSVDFDFQTGGHALLVEPLYEYFENGGVSPLGASHTCVAFQQNRDNTENVGKSIGGTIVTQVQIPRYAAGLYLSGSKESYLEVSDLTVVPVDGFTSAAFTRGIVEFDASTVVAKTEKTDIVVRNIRGPLGVSAIAHTGYVSGSLASKLSIEVTNCHNTNSTVRQPFDNISGNSINEVENFRYQNNFGFQSLLNSGWTFDFDDLVPGCTFVVDIATVSATNPPAWGASGYALIEMLDQWFAGNYRFVRVTTENNKTFFSHRPSIGWESSPQKSAQTFTTSNVTTDRTFDADSTTVAELADVLGTLISDLKSANILS